MVNSQSAKSSFKYTWQQCLQQQSCMISLHKVYALLLLSAQLTIVLSKESADATLDPLELQCPSCSQIHCTPRNAKRLICKGGVTKGICNCCPVCAKVEGESCGGVHHFKGKCDIGLACVLEDTTSDNNINEVLHLDYSSEKRSSPSIAVGICKRVKTFPTDFVGDQPSPCAPRCTPQFCEKNPRAVCSAVRNADKSSKCQGECRHTSCRACRYVYDTNQCGKCAQDDFTCIKKFGQCMRKQTCSRIRFPCKKPKRKNPFLKEGTFKCIVPDCI